MVRPAHYMDHLDLAGHYRAIGQTEIDLPESPLDQYPWHLVEHVGDRGILALSIPSSLNFRGAHPETGLVFSWRFSIERHEHFGAPSDFDAEKLLAIHAKLPADAQRQLEDLVARIRDQIHRQIARAEAYLQVERRRLQTLSEIEWGD